MLLPLPIYAKDITKSSTIGINGQENKKIHDDKENTYVTIKKEDTINIANTEDIHGIYILYELASKEGTLKTSTKSISIGTKQFLHEYIDVKQLLGDVKKIAIEYKESVKIAEIYVLGEGELPSFVEVWQPPAKQADLLLFSTHADDEQLFFLGLLPTYVARKKEVQVVYFTNHYDNPKRLHEQLHGLYTVGVRNYPIIGIVPDAYSTTLEGAIKNLEKTDLKEEDALAFEVEMLRRFKPHVVVGHDEEGEYSHGQHILNTHILKQALDLANDETYHEKSLNAYGTWNTPKTYLHLYKENKIVMEYDTPLEYFEGKTAYQVSQEGYKKHLSQQYTWFTGWMNGKNNEYTKATEIKKYSPLEFGLYRSLVGEDKEKNDMFENILIKEEIEKEESEILENTPTYQEEKTSRKKETEYEKWITLLLLFIGICGCMTRILYKQKLQKKK